MATIHLNSFTKDISGSIGNLVFRKLRGRTILAGKPERVKKQSEHQRQNRVRFKAASAWAKGQMLNPEKKAYYWRKAKKLKLPNAYTAAVSDYMRKAEIMEVDTKQFKGRAGDVIRMKIRKKDFAVHKVDVILHDAEGRAIEVASAIKKDQHVFIYKMTQTLPDKVPVRISVVVSDHSWNEVKKEITINS